MINKQNAADEQPFRLEGTMNEYDLNQENSNSANENSAENNLENYEVDMEDNDLEEGDGIGVALKTWRMTRI